MPSISDRRRREGARRGAGSVTALAKTKKKMIALRARDAERQKAIEKQVEGWFEEFDVNNNGKLEREELEKLLTKLHPDRPPSESMLDFLIEKATSINLHTGTLKGDKHGAVSWCDARATVLRYHDYCREQTYIDSVFARFDADGSGALEPTELPDLLRAIAPEGVSVDDSDAEFLLSQCDADGDGVISRGELMPLVGRWKQLVSQRQAEEAAFGERTRVERLTASAEAAVGGALLNLAAQVRRARSTPGAEAEAEAAESDAASRFLANVRRAKAAREAAAAGGGAVDGADAAATGAGGLSREVSTGSVRTLGRANSGGASSSGSRSPRKERKSGEGDAAESSFKQSSSAVCSLM